MRFSLSWLKQHLETNASIEEITQKLTDLGIEVEEIYNPAEAYKGFMVGQIDSFEKHPSADRLSFCQINIGEKKLIPVVCGAQNLYTKMKVAFAPPGVTTPGTQMTLKKTKIRGIESHGMLCSSKELGLGQDHDGIMDLKTDLEPGDSLAQALGLDEIMIDVSLTANRADCFSVYGIARDLAASGIGTLKPLPEIEQVQFENNLIKIETEKCPVFYGIWIEEIQNKQSPELIQKRLKEAGINPKNMLVDLSNYLMLDLGHPNHIYDADLIEGDVHVRQAKEGETFITLHDQELNLSENEIVIADDKKIISLAGIIGGKNTAVSEKTKNIFIETAVFDPVQIALSGQHYHLTSDARTRFERGVDDKIVGYTISRIAFEVLKTCGGKITKTSIHYLKQAEKTIEFPVSLVAKKTGVSVEQEEAKQILENLGITCTKMNDDLIKATVPSWRHDLSIPEDLVEEVLRIKGYDSIETKSLPPILRNPKEDEAIKEKLVSRGLKEVYTFSFISEEKAKRFCDELLRLDHPLSEEMAYMRPCLLPSLLDIALENANKGQEVIPLFEVASVYVPKEQPMVAGLRYGFWNKRNLHEKQRFVDTYDAKTDGLSVIGLPEEKIQLDTEVPSYYHPGRSGRWKLGKKVLGYFGELHPSLCDKKCAVFEIFLENLPSLSKTFRFKEFSPYPIVKRDLSFVVDENIEANSLVRTIQKTDPMIQDVSVFDVYQMDKQKKALAVQFALQSFEKTLSENEIQAIVDKIIHEASQSCQAVLRLHYESS